MARPTILSREDFLNSGLSIIDSEGLDALTFRHLGETMGISHTAAHSHFANRGDLLNAITQRRSSACVSHHRELRIRGKNF